MPKKLTGQNGIVEVVGSIPSGSTNTHLTTSDFPANLLISEKKRSAVRITT